jgi:hypothetical protein
MMPGKERTATGNIDAGNTLNRRGQSELPRGRRKTVRTAVYLFADRSKATDALSAMLEMGFRQEHLDLLTADESDTQKLNELDFEGGKADAYRQAVREGGTLLTVTGEETELGDADFMLMDFAPINISAWTPPVRLDAAQVDPSSIPPETEERPLTTVPSAAPAAKGRVRVDTHITTQEVAHPVHLQSAAVVVERRATDRLIAWGEHLFVAHSLDLIEFEEEAVVSRTARVIEEIVVARNFAEKVETVHDTVRRTDVIVEEAEPPTPAGPTAEEKAAERAMAERLAAERAEAERVAAERAVAERLEAERAEAERIAAEKRAAEQAAEVAEKEQPAVAGTTTRKPEVAPAIAESSAGGETAKETPESNSPWGEAPVIRRRVHHPHTFAEIERDLRAYHARSLADSGYTYEQFSPVYQFGYSLAVNDQFRGRDWAHIEADARTFWEQSNPGTWDMFKDGIYYAWAKASG